MDDARGLCLSRRDYALLQRCQDKDRAAFDEIVSLYQGKIYNYILRMTGNRDDADDLTQEVFVRMYTSLPSFRNQASLSTWLFRIASNLCIDRFRRNKKHKAIAYSLDETVADDEGHTENRGNIPDLTYEPQSLLVRSEITGQVEKALHALPEKLRAVILLYDAEGLPYEEIARVLGCPLGTVKSRLFNARLQLRKELGPYLNS
jgi:RNA polymerase sigma-70 factor (ECF subfamily)